MSDGGTSMTTGMPSRPASEPASGTTLNGAAMAAYLAAGEVARPWYLSPYRNYSYYRPWYTYGYGPRGYPYHYSPSWGYRQPWYGPQYLNPDAIAPSPGGQLYHW